MDFTVGQVVYSKNGRDKGRVFVVLSVEGDMVYLTDGKRRTLETPKRKKIKHVQPTNTIDVRLHNKIENNEYLQNADIVKVLKEYIGQ